MLKPKTKYLEQLRKKKVLNKFVHTAASQIFLKTFQQFLNEVPVGCINPNSLDEIEYYENLGMEPFMIEEFGHVQHKTRKARLKSNHGCNRIAQLKKVLNTKHLIKPDNYIQELEDRAINDSAVNMGMPSMIVPVGNREWLLANPKDFKIYRHRDKDMSVLVCTAPCRNYIYKVAK